MKFPTVFVNHGGGPMPLLGQQEELADNMRDIVKNHLPKEEPTAIIVLSAHWESNPISITSAAHPKMYFDYGGFPPESYKYSYPAPGNPELAAKVQKLLDQNGLRADLDGKRGFDHGVFVPLMLMYPKANIPVVCVSLHPSLNIELNMKIGASLEPLREEGVLIIGSGYAFHNMQAFFNPTTRTKKAARDFNTWLKGAFLGTKPAEYLETVKKWATAPGARICHPREEHLLPLFMVAAAGGTEALPKLVYDNSKPGNGNGSNGINAHEISGFLFE